LVDPVRELAIGFHICLFLHISLHSASCPWCAATRYPLLKALPTHSQSCVTALMQTSQVSGTASDHQLGAASKRMGAVWISSESATYLSVSAAQIESNYDETVTSFDEMNLRKELVHGVYTYGFERPSAVQQRVIVPMIKGERRDGGDEQATYELLG
jgi:hypothetical protein